MSWSISASGPLNDVQRAIDATTPPSGSQAAAQHFSNYKDLVQVELKRIRDDLQSDPNGKQGVEVSFSGHWDERTRYATGGVKRVDLPKLATDAAATPTKSGN